MKSIGMTQEGNHIVEITDSEYNQYVALCLSVEGRTAWDIQLIPTAIDYDFSNVFGAIRAFREAMFRVNDIERLVSELRYAVTRESE